MKTFELWATRDGDGTIVLWPKVADLVYDRPRVEGLWLNNRTPGTAFVEVHETDILQLEDIEPGEKKLLRFTVEEVTE